MGQTILIAGYGYLGEALGRQLAARGDSVSGLVKSAPTGSDRRPDPVTSCDIGDREVLSRLAGQIASPDAVVHCASSNRGGPDAYRSVFVDGSRNLTETFPRARLFLTGSTSVYGQTDGSTVTEDSPAEPERETGHLLRRAEEIVLGQGGTVLRLAGIYGPERSVHLKRFLGGTATIEAGEISRLLNQVHRDDAVSALVHLLDLDPDSVAGQVYNVADSGPLTQRACYERLAEYFGRPIPPEAAPDRNRKRAWTHKRVSNEKLRATGWSPRYPDFISALETDPDLVPSIRSQITPP